MKKILFTTFSILLLAAACNSNQTTTQTPSSTGVNSQTSTPVSSPSIPSPQSQFDTSKWKIYEDQYIKFPYPTAWSVAVGKENDTNRTVLSLRMTGKSFQTEGSPAVPIIISYGLDTYKGLIENYITDEKFRDRTLKGLTKIDDNKNIYVFQDFTVPEAHDFRVAFINNMVYQFDSNARTIDGTKSDEQEIMKVFDTILATVQFK